MSGFGRPDTPTLPLSRAASGAVPAYKGVIARRITFGCPAGSGCSETVSSVRPSWPRRRLAEASTLPPASRTPVLTASSTFCSRSRMSSVRASKSPPEMRKQIHAPTIFWQRWKIEPALPLRSESTAPGNREMDTIFESLYRRASSFENRIFPF
jgi:hypothetical protein